LLLVLLVSAIRSTSSTNTPINDAFRTSLSGGSVMVTRAVAALGAETQREILAELWSKVGPPRNSWFETKNGWVVWTSRPAESGTTMLASPCPDNIGRLVNRNGPLSTSCEIVRTSLT
jgi:hypothetical protein